MTTNTGETESKLGQLVLVETFRRDKSVSNSTQANKCQHSTKDLGHTTVKDRDPFLYYSDNEIRMKTLKGEAVSSADWKECPRKTRLSFEIDPLQGMFSELYDDDLYDESEEERRLQSLLQRIERMEK